MRLTPKTVLKLTEYLADKVERKEVGGVTMCKYRGSWTDAKVASACDVAISNVKRVRQDIYGNIYLKRRRARGGVPEASSLDNLHLVLSRLVSGEITRIIDLNANQAKRQNGALIELRVALRRIETEVASVKALLAQARMQPAAVPTNGGIMLLSEDRAQVHVQPALHADPADGKGPLI